MKATKLVIFLLLITAINSFDFGNTEVKVTRINGATATLKIYTQNNGTTAGSDLTISGLKLACDPKYYKLTCETNIQMDLSSTGTEFQCQIEQSLPTSLECVLSGKPTIISTGDSFNVIPGIPNGPTKFGDITISLSSIEGNKTTIKLIPTKSGSTTTDNFYITDLTVCDKALTCKAGKTLYLETTSGTEMECTTTEEIDGNSRCKLGGDPIIHSHVDDTFGDIVCKTNYVTSSFGKVKIGLVLVKGTSVTIDFIPEFKGTIDVDISGLKINSTYELDCPKSKLTLTKEGTQLECTISQGIEEDNLCILTPSNLKSTDLLKFEINEDKKSCVSRISKFGKVDISLDSIYNKNIVIKIKTTFFGVTESNKFIINGLKLHYDNKDYDLTCSYKNKINFVENGNDFTCQVSSKVNGGKECYLTGVAIFNSDGDTFSDITVSSNHKFSSFGKITAKLQSVIGKEVIIILSSEITGTTLSSITSIANLKLNDKDISCPIGKNINFSDKPTITCTLAENMDGNQDSQLYGNNPKIIKPDDSNDVFGELVLSGNSVTSSLGKLEISLNSVVGRNAIISLKSEYKGKDIGLTISNLYVNGNKITCKSTGEELILLDEEGNSNANISCYFYSSYYSQESNTTCTLTGTPSASDKIFTNVVIGPNKVVTSGIRDFGETKIYLSSIKGTTVTIKIMPSLSGKVRPIISNLTLEGGDQTYDVICNVVDKLQLYHNSKTNIKCYIKKAITTSTDCRLRNEGVIITSDSEDVFGKAVISTEAVSYYVKPVASDFGNTQINLTSIIGTQVNINIQVSSTTIYNYANPIIYGLYLGSTELYCVSTQNLYFTNNITQMSCSSSTPITCTSDCQLSGTPTIVTPEGSSATFGDTTVETIVVQKTTSTLGNISVKLTQVVGKIVYISVTSTNNGSSKQKVDINNLYVDGQHLTCSEEILFSTSGTQMQCTVAEPIPYNKEVSLTGTPSININSAEESADVVEITEKTVPIISKSNTAIVIELISVKENIVIISITASDLTSRKLFTNFTINGLAINEIPLDIYLDSVYLSSSPYRLKVDLNETIPLGVDCSLKGASTAQILSDDSTFGPITSPDVVKISEGYKFGSGKVSIKEVQGYTVLLEISSTKSDYTKNTELNGLYINDNIPVICKFKDDIMFDYSFGTNVECKLGSPMDSGILCTLSYKSDDDAQKDFETIEIIKPMSVTSTYKYFGDVTIKIISVNGKNVKILVQTGLQNITTTNNVKINNLYINNQDIACEFNDYIEFVYSGNELNCILNNLGSTETYTLTGSNVEIVSFADRFGKIEIDKNNTVRTAPKDIDGLTISLSSVGGDKSTIKLTTYSELYTNLQISNLRITNIENENQYYLSCPYTSVDFTEKNSYSAIIICSLSSKLTSGLTLSLVDNREEVVINSKDNFHDIIIKTNSIKSTKFGDMFINFIDSSIAINISSIYKAQTNSFINIENLQLNSSLLLDCGSLNSIEIKPAGTIIYCTLRGTNTLQGANNKNVYITVNSDMDTFSNVFLEKQTNNGKSANCYAFYNKTSCEYNPNCVFIKETYGFCSYKIKDGLNTSITSSESNECWLYLTEEGCSNNDNCVWNEQDKYSCQTRQIKNCLYLNKLKQDRCEECESGFELNYEKTKCLSSYDNTTVYPCIEYSGTYSCNSKTQCEYSYSSYNYCGDEESDKDSTCYLYITRESCNSQDRCSWKYHEESGCKQKNIDNCLKLRESNPTKCEVCRDGYLVSNGICIEENIEPENMCQNYEDDEERCLNIDYCQFSSRAYCYGEGNCFLILNQNLCEQTTSCHWNTGNWEKCQIKNISNCLELSSTDYMTCSRCEAGYTLYDYNTYCLKKNETYSNCYQYGGEEDRCVADERCEFTDRNFCESEYNNDDYNAECSRYFDKESCVNKNYCYWNTDTMKICKIKVVSNCQELNHEDSTLCLKCKDGYTLSEDSTMCYGSLSQFIHVSLMAFALILFLF